MKAQLIAELKFNKPVNDLTKASLIFDLIDKYIKNKENIFKIDKIQIDPKNANLIIFDEATSALDNQTEKEVMESIYDLDRNLTILRTISSVAA